MKLEDLAQNAARETRLAAQQMPVIPIKDARRQHRALKVVVPVLGAAAVWVAVAAFSPPRAATPPVATNPIVPTTIGSTQTTTGVANIYETVPVDDSQLASFEGFADIITPSTTLDDEAWVMGCCLVPGLPAEVLKLEPNRVLSITDRAVEVARWSDLSGQAVTNTTDGILVLV